MSFCSVRKLKWLVLSFTHCLANKWQWVHWRDNTKITSKKGMILLVVARDHYFLLIPSGWFFSTFSFLLVILSLLVSSDSTCHPFRLHRQSSSSIMCSHTKVCYVAKYQETGQEIMRGGQGFTGHCPGQDVGTQRWKQRIRISMFY